MSALEFLNKHKKYIIFGLSHVYFKEDVEHIMELYAKYLNDEIQ